MFAIMPFLWKGVLRVGELSKLDIFLYYIAIYFAVGALLSAIVGSFGGVLSLIGLSPDILHVMTMLFWPLAIFEFVSEDDAILAVLGVFASACYLAHLRQRCREEQKLNLMLEEKVAILGLEVATYASLPAPAPVSASTMADEPAFGAEA